MRQSAFPTRSFAARLRLTTTRTTKLCPRRTSYTWVGLKPGEWFNMTVEVARSGVYTIDLLYTSNRGGTISLERNGKKLTGPLQIVSTADPAETIAWRQWHHWNLMKDMAEVKLPKGVSVLTLRVLTEGNMNFAYLDFEPKGRD